MTSTAVNSNPKQVSGVYVIYKLADDVTRFVFFRHRTLAEYRIRNLTAAGIAWRVVETGEPL